MALMRPTLLSVVAGIFALLAVSGDVSRRSVAFDGASSAWIAPALEDARVDETVHDARLDLRWDF